MRLPRRVCPDNSILDGYIYFIDDNSGVAKKVVVQVTSGHVGVNLVRDLKSVIEREKAAIGALITLRETTAPFAPLISYCKF